MKKLTARLRLLGLALVSLGLLSALPGCAIGYPFQGPGFVDGKVSPDCPEAVVVVTHAVLDAEKRDAFDDHIGRVAEHLQGLPPSSGLIGFSLRKELFGDQVWTLSAWRDEAALRAFMGSPVHREAMRAGEPAIRLFRTHTFRVAGSELPLGWKRAIAILDAARPAPTGDLAKR